MSQLETMIRENAEAGYWIPDWDEVMRRAGHARLGARRAAAIGALAAVAVVLMLPGIGIGGGLTALITGSRGPGFELRAALILPDGRSSGTVSVHTSRIFLATPQKGRAEPKPFFVPRGHGPVLPPVPFRWSLHLDGGATARSAVLESRTGQLLARLCAPCSDGAHGTTKVRARALVSVFGRAKAVVETSRGTAQGTLRLTLPRR